MTTLTTWVLNNIINGEDFISKPLAADSPPKTRFLFTVEFLPRALNIILDNGDADMAKINYHLKTAGRPNVTLNQEDINYYGYRAKVLTKTSFGTVQLVFYEDSLNIANDLLWKYMNAVSPVTNIKAKTSSPSSRSVANGGDHMMTEQQTVGPFPADARDGIFSAMIVHHYYQKGMVRGHTAYTYHNPKIESFAYDELDMSASEVSTITITFSVEGINVAHFDESFDGEVISTDSNPPVLIKT